MQCSNESAFIDETSLNSMDRIPQDCCILVGSQSGPILSKYLRELRVADFTEEVMQDAAALFGNMQLPGGSRWINPINEHVTVHCACAELLKVPL